MSGPMLSGTVDSGAHSATHVEDAATAGDDGPPPPQTPDQLHDWLREYLGVTVATSALVAGHSAPFEYLVHSFFEGWFVRGAAGEWEKLPASPADAPDSVVWAGRGGGKTFLGAMATLLDLVFKSRVQVRILAGSLEQARLMYDHLRTFFEQPLLAKLLAQPPTSRRIVLTNRSQVRILSASQSSVRGTRVQKVRCDEVDLFKPDLWRAAQLTTRSMACRGPWGDTVRGSIDALSTMQNPYGLMWELALGERQSRELGQRGRRRTLFRWGVVDSLEQCPVERPCTGCGLWDECRGLAKASNRTHGHVAIDDALALKSRVDALTWKTEMLCLRPRRTDTVYPEFEPDLHVVRDGDARLAGRRAAQYIAGMDFGFRSETAVVLASRDAHGVLVVEREYVVSGSTLEASLGAVKSWIDDGHTAIADDAFSAAHGIAWIGCDPSGASVNDQTGHSNMEVMRSRGFALRTRPSEIGVGVRLVRTRLAPALSLHIADEPPADGQEGEAAQDRLTPRLYIHERCRRLIECLQRYRYPPNDPETLSPSKKDGVDHACDALRYMVLGLDRPHECRVRGSDGCVLT